MRNIRFIGDIHADFMTYLPLISEVEESIQVGDYGIGFRQNPITESSEFDPTKHRFIRGNHDFPYGCKHEANFIRDGHVEDGMMFIGGAYSIDKEWRTEGVNWWADEELSYDELNVLIDKYIQEKPRILVTHECPEFLPKYFQIPYYNIPSITRNALAAMYEYHQPELHLFGHWHIDFDHVIKGTRFKCLNINEIFDIDIHAEDLKTA